MVFLHSHRWAYHQEDIAILLANIHAQVMAGAASSYQDDSDDVDDDDAKGQYCSLNRIVWGLREVRKLVRQLGGQQRGFAGKE